MCSSAPSWATPALISADAYSEGAPWRRPSRRTRRSRAWRAAWLSQCSGCGSPGATKTGSLAPTRWSWAWVWPCSRRSATCSSPSSSARPGPRTPALSWVRTAAYWTGSTPACLPRWSVTTYGWPMSDRDERGARLADLRSAAPPSKRLLILGSTGSIGTQALDVLSRDEEEFELVGLSAERSWKALVAQAQAHGVARIALADADDAERAALAWPEGEVLAGAEGLGRLVVESGADLVLNALVGSAGLGPTVATLGEGIDLALANKESLVVGGELVVALAEATGAQIVPVDSEHTALHQLLSGQPPGA